MALNKLIKTWHKTLDNAALGFLRANANKKWFKNQRYPLLGECKALYNHYNQFENSQFFVPPLEVDIVQDKELTFESHFSPSLKELADTYASYKDNYHVTAQWMMPLGSPKATLFCIHGWQGGRISLDAKCFRANMFLKEGFALCFIELPFHGSRRNNEKPMPFPSTDLAWTNEAMAQSIHDLRVLRNYIDKTCSIPTGVIGVSLGAYVASLWATLDPFDFVGALCPAVDLAALIWSHDKNSLDQKRALHQGVSEQDFRAVFEQHSPLKRPLRVPADSRQIIAGQSDQITPMGQAQLLANHWQTAPTLVECGHVGFVTHNSPWETILGAASRTFR